MLVWYACLMTITRRALLHSAVSLNSVFSVPNASPSQRLNFYGDVDTDSCHDLITNLQSIDATQEGKTPIHLHIQSFGGDLMPMFHVLDCIDALDSPVWTYVDGYVASAASLLSVYGEKRYMTKRSFILIHELRTDVDGPYSEVLKDVSHSKELMHLMCDVYKMKTRMNSKQVEELLLQDVWLNSRMCLELGLVDYIL
tara:strand:+ start:2594 stop:3187 length:594 start_codon:yes stop_codon:yes gene_type:complete